MPVSIKNALEKPVDTNVTLRVTCMDVGDIVKTQGKPRFYVSLADDTGSCTATVYNVDIHSNFIKNGGVFLVNAINKGSYLAITTRTRVGVCKSTIVPDEIKDSLPTLPKDGLMTIKDCLQSSPRSLVSLKGKVIKTSPKTKKTAYDEVLNFQELLVRDNTSAIKVAVWGDWVGYCQEGDLVRMRRCRVKLFEKAQEKKVSTTQYTSMEIINEDEDLNVDPTEEDDKVSFEVYETPALWKRGTIDAIMYLDCYYGCSRGGCHSGKLQTVEDGGEFMLLCQICNKKVKASFANECTMMRVLITKDDTSCEEVTLFLPIVKELFRLKGEVLTTMMDITYMREKALSLVGMCIKYTDCKNVCKEINVDM